MGQHWQNNNTAEQIREQAKGKLTGALARPSSPPRPVRAARGCLFLSLAAREEAARCSLLAAAAAAAAAAGRQARQTGMPLK